MKASLRNVSIQWDKNVLGQSWCPPTFLSLTFFDIEKFLKHRTVHLRNVWVLWDKNFQRKIVKPFPLVCMKNFFGSKTSETQWRFPYDFFRYCEPKKLTRIVMPAPFVYLNIFQYQKLSETQKGSSTECFATEKQTISKHSRDAQTLSFFNIFSIWKFIWNTEGFLDELFWYCETKQSFGESWYPSPFYAWKISMLDFSEARKCSPTKCFSTVRQKNWRENRDAHPVSYPKKHFSISKSFWSTIGFLYEMFRYCETSAERRNLSGESWYTSPTYAQKLSVLKILWNSKGFPYEMRQYCEPKTLTRILMPTPFLVLNVFRYRKFSETQKGSLTKSFGTVKQNSFTENPDTPTPLCMKNFWTRFFLKRWRLP